MREGGPFDSPRQQATEPNGPCQKFATVDLDSYNQTDEETEDLFIALGCPDLDLSNFPVPEFYSFASAGTTISPFKHNFSGFPSGQQIQPPPNQPNFQASNIAASLAFKRGFSGIPPPRGQVRRQSNKQGPYPVSGQGEQGRGVPTGLDLQCTMDSRQSGQQNRGEGPPGQPNPQNPNISGSSPDLQAVLSPNSTQTPAPAPNPVPRVVPARAVPLQAAQEATPGESAPVPKSKKAVRKAPVTYGSPPPGTIAPSMLIASQPRASRLPGFGQPASVVEHPSYVRDVALDPPIDLAEKFAKKHDHLADIFYGAPSADPNRLDPNDDSRIGQSLWLSETAMEVIKNLPSVAIGQSASYPDGPHGEAANRPRGLSSACHFRYDPKYLALSYIRKSKGKDLNMGHLGTVPKGDQSLNCIFCGPAAADIGISDERFWLPVEASSGFCKECRDATSNFTEQMGTACDFIDLVGGDYMSLNSEDLDTEDQCSSLKQAEKDLHMKEEAKKYQRSVPGRHNTKSRIDGMDISTFQGPQFCYGSGQR